MSTPSSSRSSSRATLQDPPTTPDRPQMNRAGSTSVAPKSDYLRNAIQARRAQQTPTPAPGPPESRTPLQTTSRPPPVKTPKISPDIFAEYALTEEQTTPVSPIRRRRPSDAGMPRSKTNRELTTEIERLKDTLMTSNMRVELLKKNNSDLQHSLTAAKERVEQLEPLEQDNFELQDENELLRAKMEKMENTIAELRDENADLRRNNEEISQLAEESASHWQDQENAVDEAVESIIRLEDEKSALANELAQLKERVAAIESHSVANTLVDGSPGRYPVRVFSVDESRPSTSHFDSDYYSQPGSPRKEPERDSIISFTPSEKSKKFLDESEERKRSARDIFKRMSAASLKALTIRTPTPAPEVPPIPAEFKQDATNSPFGRVAKTPGRYRKPRQLLSKELLEDAAKTPSPTDTVTPHSPVMQHQGLRALYAPRPQCHRTVSDSSRPSSSHVRSPTETTLVYRPTSGAGELSPVVPSRLSSRHAHTSSSSEHIDRRSLHRRPRSDSGSSTPTAQLSHPTEEWAGEFSPTPPSIISESDLTSEADPIEDKNGWWQKMNGITRAQDLTRGLAQPALHRSQQRANLPFAVSGSVPVPAPERRTRSSHRDEISSTLTYMGSGERRGSAAPSAFNQTDFLFNGAEDEDTFMRKTKTGLRR